MAKFNLDTIIGRCVHRPVAAKDPDMFPLYKRNDDFFRTNKSAGSRSDVWLKAVEATYSSPNNIRRVFITYAGVYVHLYKPIKGAGADTMKFYKYDSVNKEFNPVGLVQGGRTGEVYKTGLGAFKGQWSCSNIEEIWFDWTLLMSAEIQALYPNCINEMTREGTTTVQNGKFLRELFNRFCLKPGEDLGKVFPRLKVIGYIDKLYPVYTKIKYKAGEDSLEDFKSLWADRQEVKFAINIPTAYVMMHRIYNAHELNDKFITRSFYSYDTEVLDPYFENLKNRMLKYAYDERTKQVSKPKKVSEFEELLNKIEQTKGLEVARQKFIVATSGADKEKLIASLSPECRAKYVSNTAKKKSSFEETLDEIEATRGLETARKMFKLMTDSTEREKLIASLSTECRVKYMGSR